MIPVAASMESPAGKVPPVIAKDNGVGPPMVAMFAETEPTCIPPRVVEVILTVPAGFVPTVPVKISLLTICEAESVICTPKAYVLPDVLMAGLPDKTPEAASRVSPDGKEPV